MAEEEDEAQYQKKLRKKVSEAIRSAQIEQQKKDIMRNFLEGDAFDRLMNIRVSNPDLYDQLVNLVVSLAQSNRVTGKITEAQLMSIIQRMTFKPDTKIEFKHK